MGFCYCGRPNERGQKRNNNNGEKGENKQKSQMQRARTDGTLEKHIIKIYLLHTSGSSSEPSEQSFSRSHIHRLRMHRPFLHLNLSASHGLSA